MEYLKQVDPQQWEQIPQLTELYNNLPNTLRCSRIKNETTFRQKTNKATDYAYIGYNTPNVTTYIVIDLDYDGSMFAYYDTGLPRPQFVLKNPSNGHCQYVYRLKDPVSFHKNSRQAPIDLLNAVERALTVALGGDRGFTGYLAKNALNPSHDVYITGAKPYSLSDLSDYLDLEPKPTYAPNDEQYGRNCGIFDAVRRLAYGIASECDYPQLYNQCLHWCEEQNTKYPDPLPYNELRSISKSIATYCTSQGYKRSLSKLQAIKGAKGGKISKRKPVPTSERTTQPWLKLGISRATYYRRQKQGKKQAKK